MNTQKKTYYFEHLAFIRKKNKYLLINQYLLLHLNQTIDL